MVNRYGPTILQLMRENSEGQHVLYSDYLKLKEALREVCSFISTAAENGPILKRMDELRKEFEL